MLYLKKPALSPLEDTNSIVAHGFVLEWPSPNGRHCVELQLEASSNILYLPLLLSLSRQRTL